MSEVHLDSRKHSQVVKEILEVVTNLAVQQLYTGTLLVCSNLLIICVLASTNTARGFEDYLGKNYHFWAN
jgi:hypothetical protein